MMIGDLLGFPHEMWPKLMEWSERTIVGGGGPAAATDDVINAAVEFSPRAPALYDEKHALPGRRHHDASGRRRRSTTSPSRGNV